MKTIFYTSVFLLLATLAQAQQNIKYVSFFPPKGVAHKDVVLTQNSKSFHFHDLTSWENTHDYSARDGGLILGAANDAVINIETMNIKLEDSSLPAIVTFEVDSIIRVKAKGKIKETKIGVFREGGARVCDDTIYLCDTVVLSAYNLKFSLTTPYFPTDQFNVRSSGRAEVSTIKVLNANNNNYYPFLPATVPADNNMNSVTQRDWKDTDTVGWRYLRIDGTEECRMYLALNPNAHVYRCYDPDDPQM